MSHGGRRAGAGRPKGSRTAFITTEGGLTPLDFLLAVARSPDAATSARLAAARAAAPYVHRPLAAGPKAK